MHMSPRVPSTSAHSQHCGINIGIKLFSWWKKKYSSHLNPCISKFLGFIFWGVHFNTTLVSRRLESKLRQHYMPQESPSCYTASSLAHLWNVPRNDYESCDNQPYFSRLEELLWLKYQQKGSSSNHIRRQDTEKGVESRDEDGMWGRAGISAEQHWLQPSSQHRHTTSPLLGPLVSESHQTHLASWHEWKVPELFFLMINLKACNCP